MKKLTILVCLLVLTACGRGSGNVAFHKVAEGHYSTYCSHIGKTMICTPQWIEPQPYVLVKGPDGGFSREDLDWIDYKNCTMEPGRKYPDCADEE